MINAKLEDTIVISPRWIQVRSAGGSQTSSGKGNEDGSANGHSFGFPANKFAVEECPRSYAFE
jgi:hypothetical protein